MQKPITIHQLLDSKASISFADLLELLSGLAVPDEVSKKPAPATQPTVYDELMTMIYLLNHFKPAAESLDTDRNRARLVDETTRQLTQAFNALKENEGFDVAALKRPLVELIHNVEYLRGIAAKGTGDVLNQSDNVIIALIIDEQCRIAKARGGGDGLWMISPETYLQLNGGQDVTGLFDKVFKIMVKPEADEQDRNYIIDTTGYSYDCIKDKLDDIVSDKKEEREYISAQNRHAVKLCDAVLKSAYTMFEFAASGKALPLQLRHIFNRTAVDKKGRPFRFEHVQDLSLAVGVLSDINDPPTNFDLLATAIMKASESAPEHSARYRKLENSFNTMFFALEPDPMREDRNPTNDDIKTALSHIKQAIGKELKHLNKEVRTLGFVTNPQEDFAIHAHWVKHQVDIVLAMLELQQEGKLKKTPKFNELRQSMKIMTRKAFDELKPETAEETLKSLANLLIKHMHGEKMSDEDKLWVGSLTESSVEDIATECESSLEDYKEELNSQQETLKNHAKIIASAIHMLEGIGIGNGSQLRR